VRKGGDAVRRRRHELAAAPEADEVRQLGRGVPVTVSLVLEGAEATDYVDAIVAVVGHRRGRKYGGGGGCC